MTGPLSPLRPAPHLDAQRLAQDWDEREFAVGTMTTVAGTRYRVLGLEPCGPERRRVYVENVRARRQYVLVVDG